MDSRKSNSLLYTYKKHVFLKKTFIFTACCVVFVTTYALILPALTLEQSLICGKEEHIHSSECYTDVKTLICGKDESEGHHHTDDCYQTERVLSCGKEEHQHTGDCYGKKTNSSIEEDTSEDLRDEDTDPVTTKNLSTEETGDTGTGAEKNFAYAQLMGDLEVSDCAESAENPESVEDPAASDGTETAVRTCEGDDYTVTVNYTCDTGISDRTELKVEEYDKNSDTYRKRYQEASEIYGWDADTDYSDDFRLFNIGFYEENEEIEPESEVQVKITYKGFGMDEDASCQVAHYGEDGKEAEIIQNETTIDGEDTSIDFTADSFSDYSTWIASKAAVNTAEGSEENLIASFSFASGQLTDSVGNAKAEANGGCSSSKYSSASAGGSDSYACYFDGTDDYLNITKADGSSLLTDYTEVSFDFWMLSTSTGKNSWPFYASLSQRTQSSSTGNCIGSYVNGDTFNVERYLHGSEYYGAADTSASASGSIYNNLVHVRVDYTTTEIILHIWDKNGNELASQTQSASASLPAILGSDSILQIGKGNRGSSKYFKGYLDELKIYADKKAVTTSHPACAMPGKIDKNRQVIYSLDGSGSSITGVPGVEYTVYDSSGNVYMEPVVTTDSYQVDLGSLPSGNYTVKQTGVPDGYVINPEVKTFTVTEGIYTSIGIFYVYKAQVSGYEEDKNAETADYSNRIYDVQLTAASGAYQYSFEAKNYTIVADQSNSMLFPSELTKISDETVYLDNSGSFSANGTTVKNSESLDNFHLDRNQVYYLLADEENTSTVFAIYYDTSNGGGWCCQDAAYYAKAQLAEIGGYSNIAIESGGFCSYAVAGQSRSSNYGTDGGDVDLGLDSKLTTGDYIVYTGSQYDRLHDLQLAIALFAEQLASLSSDSTMDIVTFDYDVEKCYEDIIMDQNGVNEVIDIVNQIATYGGTRQDRALNHVAGEYGGRNTANHTKNHLTGDQDDNIVILVTDGAPVNAGSGTPTEIVSPSAENVKKNATLMTIGLSTAKVNGGSDMLKEIASETDLNTSNDSGKWFFDAQKSGDLTEIMIENILFKTATRQLLPDTATIKDVISNSFYPVDPESQEPLTDGTKIDLNGKVNSSGPGTVHYDADQKQWYVTWDNQNLSIRTTTSTTGTVTTTTYEKELWTGHLYVKAKEDFIGGNTIDTNQSAEIELLDSSGSVRDAISLESPTVNVRLLPLNQVKSEETVFLGDSISVQDRIRALASQLSFCKIAAYVETVKHNPGIEAEANKTASTVSEDDGAEVDQFSLEYALGRELTEDEWTSLIQNGTVTIPYTFDNDSSHGAVGEFTLTLTKTGVGSDTEHTSHTAESVGKAAEEYTLTIDYEAYPIADTAGTKTRAGNVHNYGNGPGTEVGGKNAGTTLETGKGTVSSVNTHTVHVVDGCVTVTKKVEAHQGGATDGSVDPSLLPKNSDGSPVLTFTFEIYRQNAQTGSYTDTTPYQTLTVTAEADQNGAYTGTVTLDHLPRGTYLLKETRTEGYTVTEMKTTDASCKHEDRTSTAGDSEIEFTIGTDPSGSDVILHNSGTGYQSVYSYLNGKANEIGSITDSSECYGVSYEKAEVTNTASAYTLPEAGGTGTHRSALIGGLFLGAGLLYGYCLKRTRYRRKKINTDS